MFASTHEMFSFYNLWPSLFHLIPFNPSCKTDLVVMNSFNMCLPGKLSLSPSIQMITWPGRAFFGCRFFLFSTLEARKDKHDIVNISAEKSAEDLMGFSLN